MNPQEVAERTEEIASLYTARHLRPALGHQSFRPELVGELKSGLEEVTTRILSEAEEARGPAPLFPEDVKGYAADLGEGCEVAGRDFIIYEGRIFSVSGYVTLQNLKPEHVKDAGVKVDSVPGRLVGVFAAAPSGTEFTPDELVEQTGAENKHAVFGAMGKVLQMVERSTVMDLVKLEQPRRYSVVAKQYAR